MGIYKWTFLRRYGEKITATYHVKDKERRIQYVKFDSKRTPMRFMGEEKL